MQRRSRSRPFFHLLVAVGLLAGSAVLPSCAALSRADDAAGAVPTTLPTAQQVVDRYVAVTGGRAAYESLVSRRQTGTVEIPAQGVRGTTRSAVTRERGRLTSTLDGVGTLVQGFAGEIAYDVDPSTGTRLLDGVERLAAIQQLTLNAEIDLTGYADARVTAIERFRDQTCHRLELTTASGEKLVRLYDVETGLLVRASAPLPSMGEGVATIVTYADYQQAGPIRRPMFTRMQIGEPAIISVETRFTKVEHNVDLAEDELAAPDEVQKLIAATTQPSR